jgi:hypothetical protein
MDINTDTPSVDSTTTSTESISTPAIETAPVGNNDVQAVVEEFTPNYKYKAYGKEYEIDEWARPLLNKDTQPHLTKLFEKAGGFEPLKERYQTLEQEFGTYKNAYTELDQVRNEILANIQKGDLNSVFRAMGINNDQIKNYVRKQLEYEGLPAEQKQAIDRQHQLESQQTLFQRQLQEQQLVAQELMMQKHELEVMHTFSNQKYANLIETYNQRAGNDQAFRSVVDKIGAYEYTVNGRNMPVAEAVEQAIQLLGLNAVEVSNGPQAANVNAPANSLSNKPQPKPIVVPSGSSSVPVKKAVSTWEDLKRAQKEAFEN